ncbi:unnamed protein product [Adineta ricciae]|uniref:F-box domain-containing protein n=1 Tax=Adineta ricciae TaxID=249248 RepID=A0A815TAG2_ADIRI|nr:unnamed protein product [Adineta ricciae]CAF1498494.1 unnamed protein product [Adineta ricciae]
MTNFSTFEHLPNELIICILAYLQPAEYFQLFFECNQRLRKLVKQYVNYSRRELDRDIIRFSTLHSWYKHLTFVNDGTTFFLTPRKGEQERYSFDPRVSDYDGVHWHFRGEYFVQADKRIEQISKKYPVKLTPLFHPNAIHYHLRHDVTCGFIQQYHPEQYQSLVKILNLKDDNAQPRIISPNTDEVLAVLKLVHRNEMKRLKQIIYQAADSIWREIRRLEDVNILNIE